MKILYLAHRIPYPPNKGDKLRAYRHLKHLSERHDVWCACFVDTPEDEPHVDVLRTLCRDVIAVRLNRRTALLRGITGLLRGSTITETFYDNPQMHRSLEEWGAQVSFDAIVAFSSSMAPYALEVPGGRRVLDLCDLDSAKWRDMAKLVGGPMRFVYEMEGRRLARREREWARSFDAATLITEAEAREFRSDAPHANVLVVTNGVDDLRPAEDRSDPGLDAHDGSQRPPTVGFVGVMDYGPNIDAVCSFVDDCWWDLHERFPTARFRIVGRRPVRAVRRLGRVPGVDVVGAVDEVTEELRGFNASVAPLRIARGLQNKVLEAMAFGIPVVVSDAAARGIGATDGREYLVARDPDQMIRHIARLLDEVDNGQRVTETGKQIGKAGRLFVQRHHRWPDTLRRFELIVTGELRGSLPSTSVERTSTPAPLRVSVAAPATE